MEDEKKLINIDGICYRFFLNKELCEEDQESKDETSSEKGTSSVTTIKLETFNAYSTKSTYKHSFFVPSNFYGLIIGAQGATKKKTESETNTFLKMPMKGNEGEIEIIGSTGWEIISARHKIDTIIKSSKESGPYTHFISIPMNYESIISNFEEFKTEVLTNSGKNSREIDENIFQKNRKLHLTIQMLRLFDAEDKKKAAENLHACKEEIIEPFLEKTGPITIEAIGVNSMQHDLTNVHVLYAKIKDENGHLQELAEKIVDYFIKKYEMQGKYDTNVKLHMTLMNTSFALKDHKSQSRTWRNKKRVPFDATNIIRAHKEKYFGKITLSTFHLSTMREKDENGYYKMITKTDL